MMNRKLILALVVLAFAAGYGCDKESPSSTASQTLGDQGTLDAVAETPGSTPSSDANSMATGTAGTVADAGATAAPKAPKPPTCPILGSDTVDASGKPMKNPPECPQDGLGNLATWIYGAWQNGQPIWLGHAANISEKPGKWYAIEDQSVWADVTDVTLTLEVDQALYLDGVSAQKLTVVKPGCYPWNFAPNATEWAKSTFTKNQPKYCTDPFAGMPVLNGAPFVFFGTVPTIARTLQLSGGQLAAKDTKLATDLDLAGLKQLIAETLKPF